MSTPASELQKLLEIRDAGELSEAEFARAKAQILNPVSATPRRRPRRAVSLAGRLFDGATGWLMAVAVLIGGTALLALTDVGLFALGALALIALAVLVVAQFADF